MTTRMYRIDGGRYGGELVLGTCSHAFVEYWVNKDQNDLLTHINGVEFEDEEDIDPDSPPMNDDGETYSWYEYEDLEHLNSCFADSDFTITEVDPESLEEIEGTQLELDGLPSLYNREGGYLSSEYEEGMLPALCFFSSEKGSFGSYLLELPEGEELEVRKLGVGLVETELCDLIDGVFYDGYELDADYDWAESIGKGYYCAVGWYNPEWREGLDKYQVDSKMFNEYLEDFRAEYESDDQVG